MEWPATPGGSDADPGGDGGRRRWLSIAITLAVLAIAVVAARTVDVVAVLGAIRAADPGLLAAAVAVYAASWPLRGRRYGHVLAPMGHRLGTGFLTLATFASQTANLVVPARAGDAARAYLLRDRRGVPYATGAASLTVERVFDLLAIGVVGAGAVGWLVADGAAVPVGRGASRLAAPASGSGVSAGFATLGVVACTVAAGAILASRVPVRDRLRSRLPDRVVAGGATFGRDLAGIVGRPRTLAVVGAESVAIWGLDALAAVLVLAAIADAPVVTVLAVGTLAVCAGNLAKVLPLTQGGVGLYEGAFAAAVVAVSPVGGAAALAAAVLDHALKNGVTLVGGAGAGSALSWGPGREDGGRRPPAGRTDNSLGGPKR